MVRRRPRAHRRRLKEINPKFRKRATIVNRGNYYKKQRKKSRRTYDNIRSRIEEWNTKTISEMMEANYKFKQAMWDFYRENADKLRQGTDEDFKLFLKLEQVLFKWGD